MIYYIDQYTYDMLRLAYTGNTQIYLDVCAVYDSHPRRPDLIRRPMCKVIEIGAYSGIVERLVQSNSWTIDGTVSIGLIQRISVSGLVCSITWLVQPLHLLTLCACNNHNVPNFYPPYS